MLPLVAAEALGEEKIETLLPVGTPPALTEFNATTGLVPTKLFGTMTGEGPTGLDNEQIDSDLARDAGINDIGSSGGRGGGDNYGSRQGMFDQASNEDNADNDIDHDSDGFDDDGGDSDGGDSDYA